MASVLFTAPGIPMLWNGEEVGWGYGIGGSKEARSRSVINWNYQGKAILAPHYQRLAAIRSQFPAFSQHKLDSNGDTHVDGSDSPDFARITSSSSIVYAFSRPWKDQNGAVAVNFSGSSQSALLNFLSGGGLNFSGGIQPGTSYFLNNLYANKSVGILGSELDSVSVSLPPYGTAIYSISTTIDTVMIVNPVSGVPERPAVPVRFSLSQNY